MFEDVLQHVGVRGMRWGVRRDRNRPGGADGKEESTKIVDNRSGIRKKLDSMQRERQWKDVLKQVDKLNTKDIQKVSKRITLENDLKNLSKTKGVATKKDREDYLRRANMSDAELIRKVNRLRAKNGLHKAVNDASKEQREFGEKVVNITKNVGLKYAVRKIKGEKLIPKDIFDAVTNKDSGKKSKEALIDAKVTNDTLKEALKKISSKD